MKSRELPIKQLQFEAHSGQTIIQHIHKEYRKVGMCSPIPQGHRVPEETNVHV